MLRQALGPAIARATGKPVGTFRFCVFREWRGTPEIITRWLWADDRSAAIAETTRRYRALNGKLVVLSAAEVEVAVAKLTAAIRARRAAAQRTGTLQ